MFNEDNKYILTRTELNKTGALNFKDGDIVICNKYYIWIKYGSYKRPLCTTVSTRDDLRDLPISKQPYYIRDFIENYNMNVEDI